MCEGGGVWRFWGEGVWKGSGQIGWAWAGLDAGELR